MKKAFRIISSVLFLALIAGAAVAADQPTATSGAPAAVAALLKETLFPLVSALALGYLSLFLNRVGQKYKIEALTQRDNIIERFAMQGIALAEEKAAQLVGSKSELTGTQKLDIAIAHICDAMPRISREKADAIVHSLLAQTPGVGATGEKAVGGSSGVLGTVPVTPSGT